MPGCDEVDRGADVQVQSVSAVPPPCLLPSSWRRPLLTLLASGASLLFCSALHIAQNGKTPSPMDIMTNSELRKAVGAFTQSMTRLEVSMDVSPHPPSPPPFGFTPSSHHSPPPSY